jgi:hypothetical protein
VSHAAAAARPRAVNADLELDRQHAAARPPAVQLGEQELERDAAERGTLGDHRRDRRVEHAADVEAVEADDRDVAGHAQPELAQPEVGAGGEHVVVAEQRGQLGLRAQQLDRRRPRGIEVDLRRDARRLLVERPVDRAPPQPERRQVVVRREVPDAPVAELEQVPDRVLGPARDVEPHRRVPAALGLDHDDRLRAGRDRRRLDLEQQQPVGRPGPQRLGEGSAPVAVVVRVDQRDGVAGRPRRGLRAAQQPAEERVGDVGDHEPDRPRRAGLQRARRGVRPVAERVGRRAHGRLGPRRDPPRRLAGEHQRHGRLRHAGPARHVDAGHPLAPHARKLASRVAGRRPVAG